jgi:hypothetical protein
MMSYSLSALTLHHLPFAAFFKAFLLGCNENSGSAMLELCITNKVEDLKERSEYVVGHVIPEADSLLSRRTGLISGCNQAR